MNIIKLDAINTWTFQLGMYSENSIVMKIKFIETSKIIKKKIAAIHIKQTRAKKY